MENHNRGKNNPWKIEWDRRVVLETFIFILAFQFKIRHLRKTILYKSIVEKEQTV